MTNRGYYPIDDPGALSASERLADVDDSSAIRADIQRTRERMGRTVEELGERLNPDRLKQQVRQNLHDATIGKAENMARNAAYRVDETRHNLMDSIRDNPVPAAMVGIGLGWLMLNNRRNDSRQRYDRDYPDPRYSRHLTGYDRSRSPRWQGVEEGGLDYPDTGYEAHARGAADRAMDRAQEMAGSAQDRVDEVTQRMRERTRELTTGVRDTVSELAYDARDTARDFVDRAQGAFETGSTRSRSMASHLSEDARRGGHRLEDRFESTLHETPLAIGAAAVALGLAVGLSAPATQREAELMGPRRDELMDRAREAAQDLTSRARTVADRAVHEASSAISEVAREEGLTT